MRSIALATVLWAIAAVAPAGAAAAGPYEPNDNILQTSGPLSGDVTINAALETSNDQDWYRLHLLGGQQLTFTNRFSGVCDDATAEAYAPQWTLRDHNGASVGVGGNWYDGHDLDQQTVRWTTPYQGGEYYVSFDSPYGDCSYSWSVSPASALTQGEPSPPVTEVSPEPNEDDAHATGPLAGGVAYAGQIDTSNDQDWSYFYVRPGSALNLEITHPGSCSNEMDVSFSTPDGSGKLNDTDEGSGSNFLDYYHGPSGANTRQNWAFTSTDGGRYAIKISGDQGCRWQILLTPAEAVSSTLVQPPGPGTFHDGSGSDNNGGVSRRCGAARRAEGKAQRLYRAAKRGYARSRGVARRRHARLVMIRRQGAFARARARRHRLC